jgi:hypothetical protein
MKDYSTLANVDGLFPAVTTRNCTGPGATDGTPYDKTVADDMFGARQALMAEAGLTPNGVDEAAGASQALDALLYLNKRAVSEMQVRNWTHGNSENAGDDLLEDVCYGLGYWVSAGRYAGHTIQYSQFGKIWTSITNPAATAMNCVAFGNGVFLAGGDNGKLISSSDPAVSWTNRSANISTGGAGIVSICYGNGIWVLADNTGHVYTSADHTGAWAQHETPASAETVALSCVRYISALSLWIATGKKWLGGSEPLFSGIITAIDPTLPTGAWTERVNPSAISEHLYDISFDGEYVILTGGAADIIVLRSLNGISYEDISANVPVDSTLNNGILAAISDSYEHMVIVTQYFMLVSNDSGSTWVCIDRSWEESEAFKAGFCIGSPYNKIIFVGGDNVLGSLVM